MQDFDFEGYRLYKGTDNLLSDARTITDVNGTPTFYEPIAQWDLDNDISGNITVLDGEAIYNVGENTGLQFYYVNNHVTNGKIYYYVIVAYDRGIPSSGGDDPGIDPQENTFRIALSGIGEVLGTSSNAAAVIPSTMPAGFVAGGATTDLSSVTTGTGTGYAEVNIVVDALVDETKLYEVSFTDSASTLGILRNTVNYSVKELTRGRDVIKSSEFVGTSSIIDGFTINFSNELGGTIIPNKTGWISNEGQENEIFGLDANELDGLTTDWEISVTADVNGNKTDFILTDHDYELEFVDPADSTYKPPLRFGGGYSRFETPLFVKNLMTGAQTDYFILDNDDDDAISGGDIIILAEKVGRVYKFRFAVTFFAGENNVAPGVGDKIRISTTREFGSDDTFQFAMRAGALDNTLASQQLDNIYVVPNPYVGAASWERANSGIGRGERKIEFFNLPKDCTIRIFNIRGELIRIIEHEGAFNDGSASWDLKSNDSEDIAYGIYFYHVEAPGIGEYVDKFAVIK